MRGRASLCRQRSRTAPTIDFIANSALRRTLELVSETVGTVARKVELAARCPSPNLEAALQTLFNQRTERGALRLGYAVSQLNQRARKLDRGITYISLCARLTGGTLPGESPGRKRG